LVQFDRNVFCLAGKATELESTSTEVTADQLQFTSLPTRTVIQLSEQLTVTAADVQNAQLSELFVGDEFLNWPPDSTKRSGNGVNSSQATQGGGMLARIQGWIIHDFRLS
jgi:hypothetical protein